MHIALLTHPAFVGSRSQDHFAQMLAQAYAHRGHAVQLRRPVARAQAALPGPLAKWGGYVDQYLLFPRALREHLRRDHRDTLYVLCDQALGPWAPLLAARPHVVHCHDLLALRSALGEVPENPTRWSGRVYQRYIRNGFRQARHFISVSRRTRDELHRLGGIAPETSEVVPNGLNHAYARLDEGQALQRLRGAGLVPPDEAGLLLHVGGGQWYKNTAGVLRLYGAFVRRARAAAGPASAAPALWIVGPPAQGALRRLVDELPPGARVHYLQGVSSPVLQALYSLASALLFPSHAEGFGWPIAEALACGCPVLTTAEAPMTEVGGAHALYVPRLHAGDDAQDWAEAAAGRLCDALAQPAPQRAAAAQAGMAWASRYDADTVIDAYLTIYSRVLAHEQQRRMPGRTNAGAA